MKFAVISLFFIGLISSGCLAPRDRSAASTSSNNVEYVVGYNPATTSIPNITGTTTPTATATAGTTTSSTTIPAEIAHCDWSSNGTSGFEVSSSTHLGAYTLCKHQSENTVYIQLKTPITDVQLCIIPTYNVNGSTIYIGSPSCLTVPDNKTIYRVPMQINRTGFTSYNMNGVIMMKDSTYFYPAPYYRYMLSVDAYLYCANWADQYGDTSYCYAFDSVGQFVVHVF